MDSRITTSISDQSYELIRQNIVEILGVELANQSILNPQSKELDVDVWMERVIPFGSQELKPCAVNVLFDLGDYQNESRTASDGVYTYHIEIYARGNNTDSQDGDELSRYRSTKLAGVIRQILMSTQYATVGFLPGVIINRRVLQIQTFRLGKNDISADVEHISVVRISFVVTAVENELKSPLVPLGGADSAVKISCTDKGYVWSLEGTYNPDQPYPPCDCEFEVTLFNSQEKPLYVLDENTGDSFVLPNQLIVDGNGVEVSVPYDPETPYVTEACSVICEDATVNVNGNEFDNVASGDTLEIDVEYINGTPVGTISLGKVLIPNPVVCSDATAVLKNTLGTTILSENIPSGATEDIIAPNATAVLKDTDGNVLDTEAIPSDVSEDLIAPDGSVTVNSAAFDTVLSGGSLNVPVLQEVGATQVGSIVGSNFRIDDSDISINSTAFTSVAAEDNIDIDVQYANGTPVGSDVGGIWTIPNVVQDLITKVSFEAAATPDFDITIDADTAGTYTAATFGGSTTSATYEVNSVADTLPFTLVATDVLTVIPDAVNGFVRLTGTY